MNALDKSGFASLTDIYDARCISLFSELEKYQDLFLKNQHKFRSPDYKWPKDALHWWSRCWEYPYVMYHLDKYKVNDKCIQVTDVGSGVTFFPFALASKNYNVIAIDIDPIVQRDMLRAIDVLQIKPGTVNFSISQGGVFALEDNSQDIVYSISVIEHIDDPNKIISEIHRILKPNGIFIMTLDVDVEGNDSIGPQKFYDIINLINSKFKKQCEDRLVHPQDMLTSVRGPYPMKILKSLIQKMLDLTRMPRNVESVIGCYGAVYRK